MNCRRMEGGQEKRDAIVAGIYQRYLDLVLAEPNVPLVTTFGDYGCAHVVEQFRVAAASSNTLNFLRLQRR